MKRLFRKSPRTLHDSLEPKGDTVQILLLRRGEPTAAIYKDDTQEVRSPSLLKDRSEDEPSDRNS